MSTTRGCLGVVEVGPTPTVVGEVRTISMDEQAAVNDATAMGSCDAKYEAGSVTTTVSITAWFDAADAGQLLIVPTARGDIAYQPSGAGSGLPQLLLADALYTGYTPSGDVGGIVEVTFSAQGGALDRTAQA